MTSKQTIGKDVFWLRSCAWEEARRLQLKGKVTQVYFDGRYWRAKAKDE